MRTLRSLQARPAGRVAARSSWLASAPVRRASTAAVLLLLGLAPTRAHAQDIPARAAQRGVPVPEAYYARVAEDPGAFQFERAFFRRALPGTATQGTVRLPVVLGLFADSDSTPAITRDMVEQSLFTGPAPRGTVTESYAEMSRGALNVEGDVIGWVRTSLTIGEVVGSDSGLGQDARVGEYIVELLDSIDAEVDFSQYNNDGPDGIPNSADDDAFVDVITIEYLEVSGSCGGPAIWPHRWTLQAQTGTPYETDETAPDGSPLKVQDYITQSAADCSGTAVQDAGVIAHEFGHALGLPDYYHWVRRDLGPAGRRWVMGCWALMAAGSWGCGPVGSTREPFGPTHMTGHSKTTLGWIDPLDPGEVWNQEFVLGPAEHDGDVLRIPLDDSGTEFLFAELRAQTGFDVDLPATGVLLYHEDVMASTRPDTATDDRYRLTMLEQDADSSLLRIAPEGGSRGEPGDAWGVGGAIGRLDAETNPRLRLRDGTWPPVAVHEVSVTGEQARLVISTGKTPRLIQPDSTAEVTRIRSFAVPVRIAGGYGPFTGEGDLPEGFSLENVGARLFVVGSLREAGPVTVDVSVRDRLGSVSDPVSVTVDATGVWTVTVPDLVQGFLVPDEESLTEGELDYLDEIGNGNGRWDVGDLRKWLRENGS